ncbi:Rv3654c family TadE-like protein [Actinomyces israelii]|uniref:Rv3654c family TadE-like protein n=1 Tax=Actinomyces israelii TaxID=1659 RepID=UPI00288088F0|nr:Rv3654c family TadE-like protein [Actinomyces israelii]WKR20372.1 hypothetical protein AIF0345_0247 [Actinomyces israelii]
MRAQVAQALHGWGRAVRVAAAGERGAGTVLVVGVIAVLLAAALGVSGLIQAQAAAGRARTAADLAALGGATALSSVLAPGDPCEVAGRVARANGAEVRACTVVEEDVVVEVSVGVRVLGVARTTASAARAGPVDSAGDPVDGSAADP